MLQAQPNPNPSGAFYKIIRRMKHTVILKAAIRRHLYILYMKKLCKIKRLQRKDLKTEELQYLSRAVNETRL